MTIPRQIGRYHIDRELGRGGMAIVYLARDPNINRQVAIKVLPRQFSFDPNFRSRFRREAEVIARLEHPAIVPIYDFDEHDEQPYIVMRFMSGGSLAERLSGEALSLAAVRELFNQIAPALDEAHRRKIIHRDLKPGNILFDYNDKPYLSDFGIVKLATGQATALTVSGGIVGTPAYMSPEQARGNVTLDGRSDIYSLGVILFEALTGQRPYDNDTPMGLAMMHVLEPIPRIVDRGVQLPPGAQTIINRTLAKERDERYGTAVELAAAVESLTHVNKQWQSETPPTVLEPTGKWAPKNKQERPATPPPSPPPLEPPRVVGQQPPETSAELHPYVPEAQELVRQGRLSRRQFLYIAALLGCSASAAAAMVGGGFLFREQLAGLTGSAGDEPAADSGRETGALADSAAVEEEAAGAIRRGGSLILAIDPVIVPGNPFQVSWTGQANLLRQVGEYLTFTGADGITYPYLLDRYEASVDLKRWTLYLRQGILFNNGDELTMDDVLFSFEQWLDPDSDSSLLGLMSYVGGAQNLEKVDDYTLRVHLDEANLYLPEHLFHYPAIILHRDFDGNFQRRAVGTGAFILAEYSEGERAVFQRREDYWRSGDDGRSLPYLDELIYIEADEDAAVAALQSGQIDSYNVTRLADWQALEDQPDLTVRPVTTGQGFIIRMRVDEEPWDDNRVRTALKKCQDRERIMALAYGGEGVLSIDAHVSPVHAEYVEKSIPAYDPAGALALLQEYAAETGATLPLQVTLATLNDSAEPEVAQALKELAEPGGFDITLDVTNPAGYWDRWTEVNLGITPWAHRPAAGMILPLAYTEEALGSWNETRWTDAEFEGLLQELQQTFDLSERRQLMSEIEDIMQARGPIANSFWANVWTVTHRRFKNVVAHPASYDHFYEVWEAG